MKESRRQRIHKVFEILSTAGTSLVVGQSERKSMDKYNDYEPARAVIAEGARVGFVVCRTCGAALLLDEAVPFNVLEVHREWHLDHAS